MLVQQFFLFLSTRNVIISSIPRKVSKPINVYKIWQVNFLYISLVTYLWSENLKKKTVQRMNLNHSKLTLDVGAVSVGVEKKIIINFYRFSTKWRESAIDLSVYPSPTYLSTSLLKELHFVHQLYPFFIEFYIFSDQLSKVIPVSVHLFSKTFPFLSQKI